MTPGPLRRLAICTDDFGLHAGINDAVLGLAALGRVQAIGCMVGAPAWGPDSARLRGLDARAVDVGLHLDLTEHPLNAVMRSPLGPLILRAYGRRLDATGLQREIHAQLDAFEHAMQRHPDFIDGHQHVHQLPMVREALLQALHVRDPAARPWLRATRRPAQGTSKGAGHGRGFKPWLIEALGAKALARQAAAHGFAQNAHLLGVYDFQGDAAGYQARLTGWLQSASDGDLLMCHPSLAAPVADGLLKARCQEHAVLSSPALAQGLAQAGLTLAPISQVTR